jgi:hypothetical protein
MAVHLPVNTTYDVVFSAAERILGQSRLDPASVTHS